MAWGANIEWGSKLASIAPPDRIQKPLDLADMLEDLLLLGGILMTVLLYLILKAKRSRIKGTLPETQNRFAKDRHV
jgi:hypothetical protein